MAKIVILSGNLDESTILYKYISKYNAVECVLLEEPVSKIKFFKNRIKRLGMFKVVNQILFFIFNYFIFMHFSQRRKREIYDELILPDIKPKISHIGSVNDNLTIEKLNEINPDIVIVNGTRIISKAVLSSVNSIFLNIHAGITPRYRGVHGGYWALFNGDISNFGVTVHLIDEGVDTGSIVHQEVVSVSSNDDINTYPCLQFTAALPLINSAIEDIKNNKLRTLPAVLDSKIWSHPTLLEYLYGFFILRVK